MMTRKEKYIKNHMADDLIAAMLGKNYSYHKYQTEREKRLAAWLWCTEYRPSKTETNNTQNFRELVQDEKSLIEVKK